MKTKLKRFSSGSQSTDNIAASLTPQEGDESGYESIPLDRIHPDPENPRHLGLDPANPRLVAADDPRRDEKLAELEDLENLALSVISQGLLTPIRVYRTGRDFRIAHGERRFLAHVMAGKTSILSIVLKERPVRLRLDQLIENFQRKGLSLYRRVENMRSVLDEAAKLGQEIGNVDQLREATGISRSQAFEYMAVVSAPKDVWAAMAAGQIGNLELAAAIARISDPILRSRAIKEGGIPSKADASPAPAKARKQGKGRPAVVKLGTTPRTDVVRRIIEACAGVGRYDIDWTDPAAVSKVFKQLVKDIEEDKL